LFALGGLALLVLALGPLFHRITSRSERGGASITTAAGPTSIVPTVAKPRPVEVAVATAGFGSVALTAPCLGRALAAVRRRRLGRPPRGVSLRAPPSLLLAT